MRIWIYLCFAVALVGCGKQQLQQNSDAPCAGSLVLGEWENADSGDTVSFTEQCNFASSLCGSVGSVPKVTNDQGSAKVTITAAGATAGCLQAGDHNCLYQVTDHGDIGKHLLFQCDGGDTVGYWQD